VDREQLDVSAKHLVRSYQATAIYSSEFLEEHGSPPTLMAKVHHMRSVLQAALALDERYDLMPAYSEYGRVQFRDGETGQTLLLRSAAAVVIEKAKGFEQMELFSVSGMKDPSRVQLLVYSFDIEGLNLSVAETKQRFSGRSLIARSTPDFIGFWPYSAPDDNPQPPFDQTDRDWFRDVGDLDDDEGEDQTG